VYTLVINHHYVQLVKYYQLNVIVLTLHESILHAGCDAVAELLLRVQLVGPDIPVRVGLEATEAEVKPRVLAVVWVKVA